MSACRPWLGAEVQRADPELAPVLGGTAGKSLLGNSFKITESHGVLLYLSAGDLPATAGTRAGDGARGLVATVHPSAVLRAKDREEAYRGFVTALGGAARFLS